VLTARDGKRSDRGLRTEAAQDGTTPLTCTPGTMHVDAEEPGVHTLDDRTLDS
jgi:hypothetical protein